MKKVLALTMALALVAASFTGCGKSTSTATTAAAAETTAAAGETAAEGVGTVKIGMSGPLTGGASAYGLAVRAGMEVAVEEINAKGGLQIEFKAEDDEADGEKAVSAYNALKDWGMQVMAGLCILYAVITGIITGVGMNLFARPLLSLYITDSEEAISIGVARMAITVLPYFLFGMQDVVTGILRGMGASFLSMIITVLGICGIRILWIYTIFRIPAYHTQQCLYISYPLSWVLTFIVQMIAFIVVFHKCETRAKQTVIED